MSLKKPKRVIDLKLIRRIKAEACRACDAPPPSDAHHLRTKGAGGDDSLTNLISLCRGCHQAIHRMGVKTFVERWRLPVSFDKGYPELILS